MEKEIKNIIEKLEGNDIEINNHYSVKKEYFIFTDILILCYMHMNKALSVSFSADTNIVVVANSILMLKELDDIKEFIIMESFIIALDDMLFGIEAEEYAKESCIKKFKDEFIQTHNQLQTLIHSVPQGRC